MVKINLINPRLLTDEHLRAENLEITYLKSNSKKFKSVSDSFSLGKGHQVFFKNKLNYLTLRQYDLKTEMVKRGFKASLNLPLIIGKSEFKPTKENKYIILKRLIEKVKLKPSYYHYYGNKIKMEDYTNLLESIIKGEILEEEAVKNIISLLRAKIFFNFF